MVFDISVYGFLMFLTKPFRSVIGWILLLCAGAYIWARITGRIGGIGRKKEGGSGGADYTIK